MSKIIVKHPVFGCHNWPNVPTKLENVQYLKIPHHHTFLFYVIVDVEHDDRDIEFIELRIDIAKILNKFNKKGIHNFKQMSCEHLSNMLRQKLEKKYNGKKFNVYVSEDDNYFGGGDM